MENGQRGVMEGMNMSLICYNCNLLYVHLPPPRTHVGSSLLVKLSERKMLSLCDIDTGLNDSPVEYVAVADEEHGQELQQGAGAVQKSTPGRQCLPQIVQHLILGLMVGALTI